MPFAALSAEGWALIIAAIGVPQLVKMYLDYRTAVKQAIRDKEIAAEVKDIKTTGEATHTLVNSQHGDTLRLNAAVSRRLATMTKDAADIEAATLAEKLLAEHEAKQARVDAKEPAR